MYYLNSKNKKCYLTEENLNKVGFRNILFEKVNHSEQHKIKIKIFTLHEYGLKNDFGYHLFYVFLTKLKLSIC